MLFVLRLLIHFKETSEGPLVVIQLVTMQLMSCLFFYIAAMVMHTAALYLMAMKVLQNFEYRRHKKAVFI